VVVEVDGRFRGVEGEIVYRRWTPDGPPGRIVAIVHGYAEHGGRYAHVARALTARGGVVYAGDHMGHGRSEGARALITDFDHAVADLHTLLLMARDEYPRLPMVLVGHSMGGLLSGRMAQARPEEVTAVGFCGAVIGDWAWARRAITLPEIPDAGFDPLALSRDPAVGASYAADPLVYHGRYKRALLVAEVAALESFAANIDRLTMPVALFHGSADPLVPFGRSCRAIEDMPSADKEVHIYPGARHEVLNEINRDQIIGDLATWIGRVA